MPSPTAPARSASSSRPAWSETDPGFGVYVHWPFCEAKCPYCDFNSHVRHGGVNEARFRTAYLAELDHMRALTGPRRVESVFFGGGTPSRMAPQTAGEILGRIAENWSVDPRAEVTLEANPTSVEAEKFAGFRAAGVNRISIGLQALNDAVLKALGRTHDAAQGLKALEVAKARFERVSFDLIYARPRQTPQSWRAELESALRLAAGHVSLYQLTIEDGTPFAALHAAGKLKVPGEDEAADLYEVTQELCDKAGLPAYEVSNHAAPGEECRHNLLYWRAGEYAGVGPGAHSRLELDKGRHALSCIRSPEDWLAQVLKKGHGVEAGERLEPGDVAAEHLIMGLRLAGGVSLERHAALGGALDYMTLAGLETDGLVRVGGGRLCVTREGRLVLNSIIAALAG